MKIGDFGISRVLDTQSMAKTQCGTVSFLDSFLSIVNLKITNLLKYCKDSFHEVGFNGSDFLIYLWSYEMLNKEFYDQSTDMYSFGVYVSYY